MTMAKSVSPAVRRGTVWVALGCLILLGAYFRLARLGVPSLYMDNQDFLLPCQQGVSFVDVFTHWQELPTGKNHLPFPVAVTAGVLQTFHLPVTFANLILPSALWGVLVIPVAFAIGRELRGPRLGLVLAGIVALNPICIQLSRLAYYYSPALLGCFLSLWAVLLFFRPSKTAALPREFHVVGPLSAFMMGYSDASVWPYGGTVVLLFLGVLGYRFLRHRQGGRDLLLAVILFGAVGLPVLLSSWGLRGVVKGVMGMTAEENAYWRLVFWHMGSPWLKLWPALKSYAWGTTAARTLFSTVVLGMGLACAVLGARRDRRHGVLLGLGGVALTVTLLVLIQTPAAFTPARLMSAVPMYLTLLSLGLMWPAEAAERWHRVARAGWFASGVLIVAAALLAVWPAWLCTRVLGRPMPFKATVAWLDAHLPADTPILTERFFDAYNEFHVHPATNVIFMSTVRNQVPPEYLGNHFRDRSEAFLSNNPVSGVFLRHLLWDRPEVGPWTWPERFFARSIVITNEASLALHRLGLNNDTPADDPSGDAECTMTVLYNLPEDVVERARREGKSVVGFFGPGWKYVKTQDYRDWRVLGESASVDVYNLETNAVSCQLAVRGVAVNGTKNVVLSSGGKTRLDNGVLGEHSLGTLMLSPGHTRLTARDPNWQGRQIPLLVESIECRKADQAGQ